MKSTKPTSEAHGEAGFTLIEVLVALTILVAALAIAVPSLGRAREGLALRSAAYDLAASLRMVRTNAVGTNAEQGLTIDLARRLYWSEGAVPPRALMVGTEVTVPESERFAASVSRIRFYADGSSSGAKIILKDDRTTAAVYVDWLNGDVRIQMRP